MIKLTLNPDAEAQSYSFEKRAVIIGNKNSSQADLIIPGESLQDVHVKIIQDDDHYVIINAANDPFTSLNGLPFGKKKLKNHDLIQIGSQALQFVMEENPQTEASPQEPGHSPSNELESIDIDALVREVEQLEIQASNTKEKTENDKNHPPPSGEEPSSTTLQESFPQTHFELEKPPPPPSGGQPKRKKYYLQEFDDETENWNQETGKSEEQSPGKTLLENWRTMVGLFIAIISICTIFGIGFYFRASGKNSQEEKKIAAGIADIAMAMTYAQLNHITPNKQNWADPDFLQNNLAQVLSPNLHTQAQIDHQGQFNKYPYILRVYTSNDTSRFLIIAQPAPNLLQWLVHKKTIVIDSTAMEMRKITDLKKLNRLLATPKPLEGNNGNTISNTIKEGSLMPLTSLAGNRNIWGFTPPKALGHLRPGAENYIYNGPRYYPFGETLLKNAIQLNQNPGNSKDLAALKEDIEEISKFPDIVLFSSQGLQSALEAQKALSTFAPDNKFLIAYVKFHPNGHVASSHILIHEEQGEISMLEPCLSQHPALLGKNEFPLSGELDLDSLSENEKGTYSGPSVNTNHPLYLQLQAVASQRPHALKPISEEIVSLFNRQNHEILPNFEETVQNLFQQYQQEDHVYRERLEEEVARLYDEYSAMPLEEFLNFIHATKLTSFVNEALDIQKAKISSFADLSEDEIEKQFDRILNAETLEALDDNVHETAEILSLDKFPNPESLIGYQNIMHNKVLEKLSHFLLSPNSIYANGRFDEQDRTRLIAILKTSWVSQPHEYDYFLSEFELLRKNQEREAAASSFDRTQ